MKTHHSSSIVLAGFFTILLAGCANSAVQQPANPNSATPPPISEDPKAITNSKQDVQGKLNLGDGHTLNINYREDGSSVGASWPKNMAPGVPEFKYGLIDAVLSPDQGGTWAIQFSTLQSDAVAKYRQDLENAGWTMDKEYQGAIQATKDKLTLNFDLGIDGEGTGLLIILGDSTEN